MPDSAVAITPDSKIGELLERWPALEDVLVELSPHFKALRNPVLRRTVAKVATVRQVSQVSGVSLGVLVERLRAAVGAPGACAGAAASEPGAAAGSRPHWADTSRVARSHDLRATIEAGRHPMPEVMQSLAQLSPDEVYEIVTPFVPAPLLDLAREKGFEAYSLTEEGLVRTWFRRPA